MEGMKERRKELKERVTERRKKGGNKGDTNRKMRE